MSRALVALLFSLLLSPVVADERAANPFLRVDAIADARMPWPSGATPTRKRVDRFAALRLAKDHFPT